MLTSYRFRPGMAVTLAAFAILPVLIGLGLWQLDRARQKTEIRERYEARAQMQPIDINRDVFDSEKVEFRRAVVEGRYHEALTILLDNKILNGVPGYEVLTPLEARDEINGTRRFMLVNRGWISWGDSRQELPDIDTPSGVVVLSGRLKVPAKEYFTLEKQTGDREFNPRWQNLDLSLYEHVTGLPVYPFVLQLDPENTGGGGLVRQWQEYDDRWIQRHKAYAVQWFGLAVLLLGLYVGLNLKNEARVAPSGGDSNE